jgi:hypothetical protein
MKIIVYRRVLKIAVIILGIVLFATFFNKISDYYFKRPTIVILLFVAVIILIYAGVFFKEIFLNRKSE